MTGLEIAAIAIALAGAGSAIHSGEQQRRAQNKSLRAQEQAQRQDLARQAGETARAEQEMAIANRKKASPQIDEYNKRAFSGPGSTMLTSPTGATGAASTTAGPSLLGT